MTGELIAVRSADGLALVAERHGNPDGPEVLLIHGLGGSRAIWSRQVQSDLAATHHIVTVDLRGHGDADKPNSVAAYDDPALWAGDVAAVIEAAGLKRPTLVGWSLGTLVAGHYLDLHGPERVAGLNAVGAVTSLAAELQGPVPIKYRSAMQSSDLDARSQAMVRFMVECFAETPPEDELRRMLIVNGMVPRELQQGVGQIGGRDLAPAFAAVPRILASVGALDQHVSAEMSKSLVDRHPHGRLSVFEQAAHAPFYEAPERFNRELAAFAAA